MEVGRSEADGEEEAEGSAEERTKLIALERGADILHDNLRLLRTDPQEASTFSIC